MGGLGEGGKGKGERGGGREGKRRGTHVLDLRPIEVLCPVAVDVVGAVGAYPGVVVGLWGGGDIPVGKKWWWGRGEGVSVLGFCCVGEDFGVGEGVGWEGEEGDGEDCCCCCEEGEEGGHFCFSLVVDVCGRGGGERMGWVISGSRSEGGGGQDLI